MIEWLFTFLVFYLLYKLIFDFIIPVSRASVHIKSRVNQTNTQQQQTYPQQQHTYNSNQKSGDSSKAKPSKDDYLDFEEVK